VPLIPGVTDGRANLEALATVIDEVGLAQVALMPYNPLWIGKRRGLGMGLPYSRATWMTAEDVQECERVVRDAGLTLAGNA
jgi:hypothetical protein